MSNGASRQKLLTCRNLSAGYGAHPVLHDITFDLFSGELVGLAGPNGSGKSTLLHCLTGYHPLSAGSVTQNGEPLATLSRRQIAERVAFVPQHTESVYSFSVMEMVLMGRHPYAGFSAVDSTEDVEIALAALNNLDIRQLAHRQYGELSGGEKQLVLLARAFAQEAPLLMLDEPLTGLDIRHQFQLMTALRGASGPTGRGSLATFHDLAVAARWCTRIILLREGRIIDSGPPAQVITSANMALLYGVNAAILFDENGHLSIQVSGYTS